MWDKDHGNWEGYYTQFQDAVYEVSISCTVQMPHASRCCAAAALYLISHAQRYP